MATPDEVASIKKKNGIIGRDNEIEKALAAIVSGKNLMIEGPVGVGKTVLAVAVARHLGKPIMRVDGDERYTEQKLSGWFDPPIVLEKGYVPEAFIPGPLTSAMREGGVLFMNEMNACQRVSRTILLPAMDEGLIEIRRSGPPCSARVRRHSTQNPREFVARPLFQRRSLTGSSFSSWTTSRSMRRWRSSRRTSRRHQTSSSPVCLDCQEDQDHSNIRRGRASGRR